jgi:hypothetical protein
LNLKTFQDKNRPDQGTISRQKLLLLQCTEYKKLAPIQWVNVAVVSVVKGRKDPPKQKYASPNLLSFLILGVIC